MHEETRMSTGAARGAGTRHPDFAHAPGDPVARAKALAPLIAAAQSANYVACTGDYEHDPACREGYAATGLLQGVAQTLWVLQ